LAALAQIPHHRLLVGAGGGMRGQGLAHGFMGGDRGLFGRSAGGVGHQLPFDGQEVGGGPAAFLQGPVGDHTDRPLGQEPIANPSSSARRAPASPAPMATKTSCRAKVDAVAVNPSGPASRSNS
jgi:hypothetical protein